jgi:hypothetical protein
MDQMLLSVEPIDSTTFFAACRNGRGGRVLADLAPLRRISELFEELTFEEFLSRSYGVAPCVLRRGPGRPAAAKLPDWAEFSQVLVGNRPTWPRIRLVNEGVPVTPSRFLRTHASAIEGASVQLLGPELIDEIRGGATLVFDGVEECHPGAKLLASDFEYVLREPTSINAYASFHARSGFGPHWDDHDVFVFQVHGSKQWEISPPTRSAPVRGEDHRTPRPATAGAVEVLEAGDVLYLPRGWWHDVAATDGPSLHYTMSVPRRLGLHLLGWVGEIMQDFGQARLDVPRVADPERRLRYDAALLDDVLRVLREGASSAFLDYCDAAALPRPDVALPLMAQPEIVTPAGDQEIVSRVPRPVVLREAGDGSISFGACGKWFRVTAHAASLLTLVFSGHEVSVAQAMATVGSPEQTAEFLEEMSLEGAIAIRSKAS